MSKGLELEQKHAPNLRIGIVVAKWNEHITKPLRIACVDELRDAQIPLESIIIKEVPGAFELPYVAAQMIKHDNVDAVVVLGCLIKGESMHFEYISEAVAHGAMKLNIETDVPVIFGVLTCLTEEQAIARSTGTNNHGAGWGKTAVEMGLLKKERS